MKMTWFQKIWDSEKSGVKLQDLQCLTEEMTFGSSYQFDHISLCPVRLLLHVIDINCGHLRMHKGAVFFSLNRSYLIFGDQTNSQCRHSGPDTPAAEPLDGEGGVGGIMAYMPLDTPLLHVLCCHLLQPSHRRASWRLLTIFMQSMRRVTIFSGSSNERLMKNVIFGWLL